MPVLDKGEVGLPDKKAILDYRCPNCRRKARAKLLDQILDILIAEDKQ